MWFSNKISSFLVISLALVLSSNAQNTIQDVLDAHNTARALVGVSPISWNVTLASYAKAYASSRGGNCTLLLSGGPYGENLATGSSSSNSDYITALDAVNLWVDQKQYYDHDSNTCAVGQVCLDYTQVVWSNSTTLGCSRYACTTGGWYVICSYNPPGNIGGESPY